MKVGEAADPLLARLEAVHPGTPTVVTNSERVMRFNHILFKEPGAESYRHLLVASNLVVPPSGSWTSHVSLAVVVSRGRSVGGAPVDDSPARMCGNNKPCMDNPGNPTKERQQNV